MNQSFRVYSSENTKNILLQSSNVIIPNNIYDIHEYKLEIYTNGNIKIINETQKTDYFYINDYIELIPSIINMHTFLFQTLCDKNQLDNFILSLKASKKNFFKKKKTE